MNGYEGLDLSNAVVAPEQPRVWEVETKDRLFFKQMHILHAGTFIPQHSHDVHHSSLLAVGALRLWKDGVLAGDFKAPQILSIDAGVKHLFMALVDNTVVYCAFNLMLFPSEHYQWAEEHNPLDFSVSKSS